MPLLGRGGGAISAPDFSNHRASRRVSLTRLGRALGGDDATVSSLLLLRFARMPRPRPGGPWGHTTRLFPLFSSFVLLAGPACAQQLAVPPPAKPECPPAEPD